MVIVRSEDDDVKQIKQELAELLEQEEIDSIR
jgi:hypothetical protein